MKRRQFLQTLGAGILVAAEPKLYLPPQKVFGGGPLYLNMKIDSVDFYEIISPNEDPFLLVPKPYYDIFKDEIASLTCTPLDRVFYSSHLPVVGGKLTELGSDSERLPHPDTDGTHAAALVLPESTHPADHGSSSRSLLSRLDTAR